MNHSPDQKEQVLLDGLLERYDFQCVTIRLTATMLEKSIIDAGEALRYFLKKSGLVEFAAIPPEGAEAGIRKQVKLITAAGTFDRTISFYRPKTKSGDPRIWLYDLGRDALPGDLLVCLFSEATVYFLLLKGFAPALLKAVGQFLPPRHDSFRLISEAIQTVETKVRELAGGWIPTMRSGATGIGFTIESLLGLSANVRQNADLDGVELKAHRTGSGSRSNPLITLFSKTPEWGEIDRTGGLVSTYGYEDPDKSRKSLYCSITSKANPLGWKLEVAAETSRVNVCHQSTPVVYYTLATLESRLNEKHSHTLFISAEARGSGANEEFLFNRVTYCSQPSIASFIDLVQDTSIGLDFAAHVKNGRPRDHGYLWRIRESRIPALYAYQKVLL